MAGLSDAGFQVKTVTDILSDMETQELAQISPALDVQPTSIIGVLNGIVAAALAELWQLALALYSGMNPDMATGDQLTGLALLTGTQRAAATPTVVKGVQVTVAANFSAAAGDMIASVQGNPAALFYNKTAVQNGGSQATLTVDFQAVTAGPTQCAAGALSVIAQPLSGWISVTNPTSGIVGSPVQTDPQLRVSRTQEISQAGSATAAAIQAAILSSTAFSSAVLSVRVLANDTDNTDVNGLPPHSLEVICYQPGSTSADDTALAQLILNEKAAGDGTYGSTSVTVSDSQGNQETVRFSRPTAVNLYVAITVVTDPKTFPADGVARIQNALVAYAQAKLLPGATLYMQALKASVFPTPADPNVGVAGVLDVTAFAVDTSTPPTNTNNLLFAYTQIAVLDASRITVTVT